MLVIPIGMESLGVRSSCFFVETNDCKILIDPSVSLCPKRGRLPPHIHELVCAWYTRLKILHFAEKADLIIQTHYHGDHFSLFQKRGYEFTTPQVAKLIYTSKTRILAKDPHTQISRNQRFRAKTLWDLKNLTIEAADNKTYEIGETKLTFSSPLWHGVTHALMGTVIAVTIQHNNDIITFSSDINGPGTDEATQFLMDSHADLCFVDGPSTYLKNRVTEDQIETAFEQLSRVSETSKLVVDHHSPRDLYWDEIQEMYGCSFPTCATYFRLKPFYAEAQRKMLFDNYPFPHNFYSQFFKGFKNVIIQVEEILNNILEKYQWKNTNFTEKEYMPAKKKLLLGLGISHET